MKNCDALTFFRTLWKPFVDNGPSSLPMPQIEMRYTERKSFDEGQIGQIWEPITRLDKWVREGEKITSTLPHNVHYSLCPKKEQSGTKSSFIGTSVFWADVDHMELSVFRDRNLPMLERSGISPTMLVSSGWGIHVFWVLDKVFGEQEEAEKWNRFLAWVNGGDQQASNIAHTLRFPTSYNCKALPYRKVEAYIISGEQIRTQPFIRKMTKLSDAFIEHSSPERSIEIRGILDGGGAGGSRKKKQAYAGSAEIDERIGKWIAGKPGEEIMALLKKWSSDCPVLQHALFSPRGVEYQSWLSLGAGISKVFGGGREAEKIFHLISELDIDRYSESGAETIWNNIISTDLNAYNCSRLPESRSCGLLAEGKCRNIMGFLKKKIFSLLKS